MSQTQLSEYHTAANQEQPQQPNNDADGVEHDTSTGEDDVAPRQEERENADPHRQDNASEELAPRADHTALADVNVEAMELGTNADGWSTFPHPGDITAHLDEDQDANQSVYPDDVNDAIDQLTSDPTPGEFLVLDATTAYEYLESLQWKSDHHLETFERQQLIRDQLSNGRGYARGAKLSTYDKKWICEWEVRRRLAERDRDEWKDDGTLNTENTGLPDE